MTMIALRTLCARKRPSWNSGLEERLHQGHDSLVPDLLAYPLKESGVRNGVEGRFDVSIQHLAVALGAQQLNLGDRVVSTPLGPEPVGTRSKSASKIGSNTSFSAAWTGS